MKNMKHLVVCAAGALALAVTGCGTPVNSVENAQKEGQRNMVADQRVISDPGLNRHVNIVGVNTAMTPGGLLSVQVELQNNSRSQHRFNYQFEWFDANGMIVETSTSIWIDRRIQGGETISITALAPTENAKDFRIKMIER